MRIKEAITELLKANNQCSWDIEFWESLPEYRAPETQRWSAEHVAKQIAPLARRKAALLLAVAALQDLLDDPDFREHA